MAGKARLVNALDSFPARDPSLRASPFRRDPTVSPQVITEEFSNPIATSTRIAPGRSLRGRTGSRGGVPSRMSAIQIDPRSIDAFYEYAQDFKENAAQFAWGMDKIVMMYALIALAGTQRRALGPVDPQMKNIAAAWKIPVRRITGAYLMGWEVRHIRLGFWQLTNTSREAYFIEFGINHVGTGVVGPNAMRVRIRRPVMKLAVMEAINIVRSTNADVGALVAVVSPSGLYQSPMITGGYRPKGPTGGAGGLVNWNALSALAGSTSSGVNE